MHLLSRVLPKNALDWAWLLVPLPSHLFACGKFSWAWAIYACVRCLVIDLLRFLREPSCHMEVDVGGGGVSCVYDGYKRDYGEGGYVLSKIIRNFIALDIVVGFDFLDMYFMCGGDKLFNFFDE